MSHKLPLAILVVVHVALGLVLGFFAEDRGPPNLETIVYAGVFFSQTCLLGFWFVVSDLGWVTRLVGIAVGLIYLVLQFCFSIDVWEPEVMLLVWPPTLMVAAVLWLFTRFVGRIKILEFGEDDLHTKRLQFSVRQLLLITLALSCTLAIVRIVQPYIDSRDRVLYFLIHSLSTTALGLTSIWIMFGNLRLPARICIGFALAWVAAFCPHFIELDPDLVWIPIFFMHTLSMLLSLGVVRWCGYRFVRYARVSEKTL